MAIVTRYFSTASAGAADGTTWADRAILFTGGAWSAIITGFNFAGTDSMLAFVGPGTHTITVALAAGLFANPPTLANGLNLAACDSSGARWVPPSPGWVSAEPVWDVSNMPVIATTTNIVTINHSSVSLYGLKFTASGATASTVLSPRLADWCVVVNSTSNTGASGCGGGAPYYSNFVVQMTGTAYSTCVGAGTVLLYNVRVEGNPSATTGTRYGFQSAGSSLQTYALCTSLGNVGDGFTNTSASNVNAALSAMRCVSYGNVGAGFKMTSAGSTVNAVIEGCVAAANTGYGVSMATDTCHVLGSRLRDNTAGNFGGITNQPTDTNATAAGTDADEFVNVSGAVSTWDLRIKNTSGYWGKGYGAGDEEAAAGGGLLTHPGMSGGMRS